MKKYILLVGSFNKKPSNCAISNNSREHNHADTVYASRTLVIYNEKYILLVRLFYDVICLNLRDLHDNK